MTDGTPAPSPAGEPAPGVSGPPAPEAPSGAPAQEGVSDTPGPGVSSAPAGTGATVLPEAAVSTASEQGVPPEHSGTGASGPAGAAVSGVSGQGVSAVHGGVGSSGSGGVLRPHAEHEYAEELARLAELDERPRPPGWRLSPWAVTTYLLGGELADGTVVTPKYVGPRRLIEVAVATLATDRALLLLGVPGTAKTWVSEHLAAAISGDSTLLVQGTAGTPEEAIRYGWDYARLLAEGPSEKALVPSPLMRAMLRGAVARVEELTRIPSDVQDALITILSEKALPIPELDTEVQARRGFTVIATANDRDRGVNELSSALRRRFNTVVLPVPASVEDEVEIVARRVAQLGRALELPAPSAGLEEIRRVVTVLRELRSGRTEDGRTRLKTPSGTLSTAEAISVVTGGLALAAHFGDGTLRPADLAAGLRGTVVQDPASDPVIWQEYLETVVRDRPGWRDFYQACRDLSP